MWDGGFAQTLASTMFQQHVHLMNIRFDATDDEDPQAANDSPCDFQKPSPQPFQQTNTTAQSVVNASP
jgi:hypothetical protein